MAKTMKENNLFQPAHLIIRKAVAEDVKPVCELLNRVYADMTPWLPAMIQSQIERFPEGQFVALYQQKIVGYCATLQIAGEKALTEHTWESITGGGYLTTHDSTGDYLYGIEACVDPAYRQRHIGHRFYNARKKYCLEHGLKGIIIGGRMVYLADKIAEVGDPKTYVQWVRCGKIYDTAMTFQMHNGFEPIDILKDYLPDDQASLGYAALLIWRNPELKLTEHDKKTSAQRCAYHHVVSDHVRVASVQYKQRQIDSFDAFEQQVKYFVSSVAEYRADFIVFPESFTMQLLSLHPDILDPRQAIKKLTEYTDRFRDFMQRLSLHYHINIIGGSHPTQKGEALENMAYVFLRDGSVHSQAKIHPTPDERTVWRMEGGDQLNAIETDCGPIGVLICYDCEFPELARHLVDQGMHILFIPFCTDERRGYLRVRYCAAARAIENQCFVVTAGNVGNLPHVVNMNVQYAQSCILTPSDFPFSRDGIAQDSTPNSETVVIADLNQKALISARNAGTVLNLKDRRHDLYSLVWHKNKK